MISVNSWISISPDTFIESQKDVRNEPMFFRADADFAYKHGGPVTKSFLDQLSPRAPILFDSKVVMLMKGWYPCIPGWHHDDVPRDRPDGQPEYFNPSYRTQHAMAIVGDEICQTEYALGHAEFPIPPEGSIYYGYWHHIVEEKINQGELKRISVPSNRIINFDDRSWHQGVRASGTGWRWFGRVTYGSKQPPMNEIRQQVQVYLDDPLGGW